MSPKITRRQVLVAATSVLLLPIACTSATRSQTSLSTRFSHGVASGDPDQSSVVIWSRVSGSQEPMTVRWFVANDVEFKDLVNSGEQLTDESRDYTVKVIVNNLEPGKNYYYGFSVDAVPSPIGRTHTLPTGHVKDLVLAVATCSNYPFGYFNAYEAIANDQTIDLVVHLGDYIYEYAEDGYGGETGKRIGRVHDPRHEITTLTDYRLRHAQYKTDEGSLAMHARHPLVVIWDDHESANNPWMGGAENHQPEEEGSWKERRAASLQAYYEWLPIRDPVNKAARANYWRHYKFGDLASLITLESRHTGRSLQISYGDHQKEFETPEQAQAFYYSVVAASDRTFLSKDMEKYLKNELAESVNSGRRWRIIGNQSVMAKSVRPKIDEPLFRRLQKELIGNAKNMVDNLLHLGELELPGDLDAWDGYPAARERFYQIAKNAGARDLLVLSGDSHSCWANALYDDADKPMGLELGATGISSPRSLLALGEEGITRFDALNAANNKEIVWSDGRHRGFIRLQIDHEGGHADFIAVSDVESRSYTVESIHSVDIGFSGETLSYV